MTAERLVRVEDDKRVKGRGGGLGDRALLAEAVETRIIRTARRS